MGPARASGLEPERGRAPGARARARGGAEGGWRGARCCRRTAPQPLPRRSLALRSGNSVDGGVPLSPGTRLPPPGSAQVQSRGATLVRTDPRPWVGVGQGGKEALRPRAPLPAGLGESQPRTSCPLPSWNRNGKARRPALSVQPFAGAQRPAGDVGPRALQAASEPGPPARPGVCVSVTERDSGCVYVSVTVCVRVSSPVRGCMCACVCLCA